MKVLFKIFLVTGVMVLSGCGDDQSNKTTTATPAVTKAPATAPSGNDTKMETMEKIEKPAWAVLEQNVYHYPE